MRRALLALVIAAVAILAAVARAPAQPPAASELGIRAKPTLKASMRLPADRFALSFDIRGPARVRIGAATVDVAKGAHHVEATATTVAVGQTTIKGRRPGTGGRLSASRPPSNVLVTRGDRAEALLLHRAAALRARVPAGLYPIGEGADGVIHFRPFWTSGFWVGLFWNASDLGGPFQSTALSLTLAHFGREQEDTHDLGFLYGSSSVAAYEHLCRGTTNPACPRLRSSAIEAAESLVALAATNPVAGTIPIHSRTANADTIIDSMMNLELVAWAGRETGEPRFREVVERHATNVARTHVRPDGSTFQSVHQNRDDGTVLSRHTHQGMRDDTTWSRGQSWGLHGFAQTALDLDEPAFATVAERIAVYVAAHLPADGIPRYDYAASARAPLDVSAGVIAAAGLYRLDAACRTLPSGCTQPERWRPLADRMLAAALKHVSRKPPLGRLGDQALTIGGRWKWDDRAELVFGLFYALQAIEER